MSCNHSSPHAVARAIAQCPAQIDSFHFCHGPFRLPGRDHIHRVSVSKTDTQLLQQFDWACCQRKGTTVLCHLHYTVFLVDSYRRPLYS